MNTSTDISTIELWFERAVPEPTDKSRATQVGVHFEEVVEMCEAMNNLQAADVLRFDADYFKGTCTGIPLDSPRVNRLELLDALCDQIVTAIGVAHMFGMDISGALNEVNASNFSKFGPDGQPIFDENGKIKKGPNYRKPDLTPFV